MLTHTLPDPPPGTGVAMEGVMEDDFSTAGAGVLMGSAFFRKNEPIIDLDGVVVAVGAAVAAVVAVPACFVL